MSKHSPLSHFFICSYDAHIRNNLPEVFVQESVEHWVCNSRGHAYQVADTHTYREGFFILEITEKGNELKENHQRKRVE